MTLFGGSGLFTAFPYEDPVILHRRLPVLDGNGKPVNDNYGDPTFTLVDTPAMGAFAPTGSSEDEGQDTATEQPSVYLPSGTDVTWLDTVEVRGTVYQVAGVPGAWSDMGVEVRLQAVTGEPR